jgi:predicted ATPase
LLLKSLSLANFLSFGPSPRTVDLLPLNVVIGPNGSGKSNLIEAIELIRAAPRDFLTPIRDGGGVHDWLWKRGTGTPVATIDAVFHNPKGATDLRYVLRFTEAAQRFEIWTGLEPVSVSWACVSLMTFCLVRFLSISQILPQLRPLGKPTG